MVWNRFCAALGVFVAVLSALVMVLWGGAIVRTLTSLTEPADYVVRELNLIGIASMGLGLGMCLVIYGLGQARRQFRVGWAARSGIVLGALMILVGSTMLFAAIKYVAGHLEEITRQPDLITPENVGRLIHSGVQRSTLAAFTLFSATIVLAMGIWKLFWLDPHEIDNRRSTFWTSVLTFAILSATTFGLLYQLAAAKGRAAMAAVEAAPADQVPSHLYGALTYSQAAAACLAVAGLGTMIIGLGFRSAVEPE